MKIAQVGRRMHRSLTLLHDRLGRYGNVYPIGSSVGTVSVGGYSWTLWAGYNGSMKVFSFIASNPVTGFNTNIKEFFNYLANSQGFPASSQHLISMPSSILLFFWKSVVNRPLTIQTLSSSSIWHRTFHR